jgi:hypothetical protein
VSCKTISNPALDRTIPVNPPRVNKIKKPKVNIKGTLIRKTPPHKVAIQLKILIPVGTAMIIVAAVK